MTKIFEDQLILKIKGCIIAIKNGTKTPVEAGAGKFLNKLKEINEPMYQELLQDYKAAFLIYKKSEENQYDK